MRSGSVTTPFGRRPMTLALMKGQVKANQIRGPKAADKWKVFRDLSEARAILGLQDRTLAVLNALLSFYPGTELSERQSLVVFPSNAQLSLRAHGIAGTTLRRHLATLVEAGIVHRRDSPNGKRYARRGRAGDIEQAFGFNLAPLLSRADEFARLALEVAEERRLLRQARETLTICRRDVRKLISAALQEGADGDWLAIEARYADLTARLPRVPSLVDVEGVLPAMEALREEIVNALEKQMKLRETAANDIQNGRHIQNSHPESIPESEPQTKPPGKDISVRNVANLVQAPKAFPLGMVLKACPQVSNYAPDGRVTQWRDLMSAAAVIRSALGVSPSAYQEACEVMGPESAATAMSCILERAGQINNAGGFLRDLTRKAATGRFSPGPMLMALMRAHTGERRST